MRYTFRPSSTNDKHLTEVERQQWESDTLADGLEQGVYPFGVCIRTDRSRVFQIFKKKLDAWIAEREE